MTRCYVNPGADARMLEGPSCDLVDHLWSGLGKRPQPRSNLSFASVSFGHSWGITAYGKQAKGMAKMAPNTKESIEKAAYTAVGAPVAAVKALGARVSDLRDAVKATRGDLSEDLAKEFDTWVAEGERVVNKALERLRKTGAVDRVRSSARTMRETIAVSIDELGEKLDIVEPEKSLEMINGIGPSTSDRLMDAGLTGITSLLEKTSTRQSIEALAEASGYSTDAITGWREQADLTRVTGVGDGYRRMLHRLDIWTIGQLASADPKDLASSLESIDLPGMPEHRPGVDQFSNWIREAGELDNS